MTLGASSGPATSQARSLDIASLAAVLDGAPAAFAVTLGPDHTLVAANAAFRTLVGASGDDVGRRIAELDPARPVEGLGTLLDEVIRTGSVVRDRLLVAPGGATTWSCTAWPVSDRGGEEQLVMFELRANGDRVRGMQRELGERMLLGALRDRDAADSAEAARQRAEFIDDVGRRLAGSIDLETTQQMVARLALPRAGSWCIVDLVEPTGTIRRLPIVHPDGQRQRLATALAGRWQPEPSDPIGIPSVMQHRQPRVIDREIAEAVVAAAHDPETLDVLRALGVGPLLTVPLVASDRLIGAITFVAAEGDPGYSPEEVELARQLGTRSGIALDNARLHGEAVYLKMKAESANEVKTAFLGAMGHELRTPLNAIGGYADIMAMGIHGPVTPAQESDLARIKRAQAHLTGLVTDILTAVRLDNGGLHYQVANVAVHRAVVDALALVEPMITAKGLQLAPVECEEGIVVRGDRDRFAQIIVNLMSNAIKFTPSGGHVRITCGCDGRMVQLRMTDDGIGIPADQLSAIFEPFYQVHGGLAGRYTGVGLGLAISRELARGMGGDLTVESELGVGTTMVLTLMRAEEG